MEAISAEATGRGIPFAGRSVIALDPDHFAAIRRTVRLLHRLAHSSAHASAVDRGADDLARFAPGNTGVLMGYDFHLAPDGPRLIEVNTNAGGSLLNGLHTASLCDPAKLACHCQDLAPAEEVQERILRTFIAEFRAVRGEGARLERVAIADEDPHRQFLYREFELFSELFEAAGIAAEICDTEELERRGETLTLRGRKIDLVYLRDTDFMLGAPRSRALRDAYLAREVVVTPSPREHHLLADKRRLAIFSARDRLLQLGLCDQDARFLAQVVPETLPLGELGIERAWRERREWVFKPCASFGSRAVYRGDKLSRRRLAEIARNAGYVAQRRVAPGELRVETSEGTRPMKFDVRAYAYREEVLLMGARVYQGQVTNLRSPGGGFSAICVASPRAGEASSPPGRG